MKAVNKLVDVVGALSLIGMVLLAILMTRNNYSQYWIGGGR